MFTFLLVVHAIIAAALVTVILMQRSEGGGLGMGSGPSGLMTARGAADFLTRATSVLAALFVLMAFVLATLAATRNGTSIDTSLAKQAPLGPINAPAPAGGTANIPMMGQPLPIAPDGATSQALAPASAGLPTQANGAQPVPAPKGEAKVDSHLPPVAISRLKKIDAKPVGPVSVGINGIQAGGASNHSAPATAPVTPPTLSIAPPASTKPAPAASSTPAPASGNSNQPQ